MTTQDAAVTAAAVRAIRTATTGVTYSNGDVFLADAVAAARPIIEAEARERIAAEIEAEFVGQDHHEPTFNSGRDAGLRLAARIARGTA